jgi:hypothetical protein
MGTNETAPTDLKDTDEPFQEYKFYSDSHLPKYGEGRPFAALIFSLSANQGL